MHIIRGRSTIFGLNVDGSIDPEDNGRGAFGYNTRDKNLLGVSLPIALVRASIGDYALHLGVWEAIHQGNYRVVVRNVRNGRSILAPIVDLGPAAWTHNAIDLTYAADHYLGTEGDGDVEYSVFGPDGFSLDLSGFTPSPVEV